MDRWDFLKHTEMEYVEADCPFLVFSALREHTFVVHGCSTREGGVSEGEYSTMNLMLHRGDETERVLENYRRICGSIGFSYEKVVLPDQVHELTVRRATRADISKGLLCDRDYERVDAEITNEPGVALVIFTADCVPILFVDPVSKAIGTAHAGWKGTIGRIAEITVHAMQEAFGSKPSDIYAYMGPSICGHCYTVSGEVAQRFLAAFPEEITPVQALQVTEGGKDEYQLDLWGVNKRILTECGLPASHIVTGGVCTKCHPELLFSHRVMGAKRGSLASFLMIKEHE